MGGAIGLHLAVHAPDRVLTLQLHSSRPATRGFSAYPLGLVKAPTLITVGDLDYMLPVSCSRELHAAIAGSELLVFEGCGHLVTMENSEEFNRVTLDWLRPHLHQERPAPSVPAV